MNFSVFKKDPFFVLFLFFGEEIIFVSEYICLGDHCVPVDRF